MDRTEFDKFAEEYRELHATNIAISGEAPEYFAEYKVRKLRDRILKTRLRYNAILDLGAGVGTSVPYFSRYFPESKLTCLDVSEKSLSIGAARFQGSAEFRCFDGADLPFEDLTFDVAFAACVFHHIDSSEHVRMLRELYRVLRPGGLLCIFEHNPLNPLTRYAVATCPFDENAALIRPGNLVSSFQKGGFDGIERTYHLFFPRSLRWLRRFEGSLGWCPVGAQYSVMATK